MGSQWASQIMEAFSLLDMRELSRIILPKRIVRRLTFLALLLPLGLIARSGVGSGVLALFSGINGAEISSPHGGRGALNPEVREIWAFIRAYKLRDYRMSELLIKKYEGMEIYQRVTEAVWLDAKYSHSSGHLFVSPAEMNSLTGGRVMRKGKHVVLLGID